MFKAAVVLLLAAATLALAAVALAQESPPEAPQGVQLRMRDGGPLITWLPVTGAETYEVRDTFCESGSQTNCAISDTAETSWQGPPVEKPEGRYLVAACNDDSSCGEAVQPVLVDDRPESPEQVGVEQTPDGVLVSWSPVDGASEYQVIYDDRLSRICNLKWPEQELRQCQEAGRTTDTRFLHQAAAELQAKYYWVAACNQAGCRKGKGKGAEIGDSPEQPTQEPEPAAATGRVEASLTFSRQSVREGENFTATLDAQAPSGEPGTLKLRLNADGPLHVTAVAGQESCGPGCVSLTRKIVSGGRGSLSASFTAGERGSAKIRGSAQWEPDGQGESLEDEDERTVTILAGQDSPDPVIWGGGPEARSTAPPAPVAPTAETPGSGCNSFADSTGPGSLVLLGLLILPVVGLVARPRCRGGLFPGRRRQASDWTANCDPSRVKPRALTERGPSLSGGACELNDRCCHRGHVPPG